MIRDEFRPCLPLLPPPPPLPLFSDPNRPAPKDQYNLFSTLTKTTPSVSTPLASSKCTNLYPSLSLSSLTQAQAARLSLPISSSLTRNLTNDNSGTTPGIPSKSSG